MTSKEKEKRISEGFQLTATASELMDWGTEHTYRVVTESTDLSFTIHEAEITPLKIDRDGSVEYLVKPTRYELHKDDEDYVNGTN